MTNEPAQKSSMPSWWGSATSYQKMVLFIALLGWVFDSMDATIYSIVQTPALMELLKGEASKATVGWYGGIIFSIFVAGWAIGGVLFGVMADYYGRTTTLVITILIYALFTGAAAFSHSWWELGIYRFICGLGIGGEWAAGAALVAEVWPDKARAKAAAVLQSAWAIGYFIAAVVNLFLGDHGWRVMFLVGIAPAVVALLIRMKVKEPECWSKVRNMREEARRGEVETPMHLKRLTLTQLFEPGMRRDTIVGSLLASVAAFALWGATNWIPSIIRDLLQPDMMKLFTENEFVSLAVMSLNLGALAGYWTFAPLADRFGRRAAFLLMMIGSALIIPVTFLTSKNLYVILAILPFLGFFTNGIFSGFPIYLPELFPIYIRTTGAGFCFNVGRIISALGPFITGALVFHLGSFGMAASAISLVYIIGMITLIFARETKGISLDCE